MTIDQNLMPSSLDREISSTELDAFGHRHFAQVLRSLIESEKHTPPFSIGLLGGWGTGKSTIKELYKHDLEEDSRKKNKDGRLRSDRFHLISFNAWRFGGKDQDIKRALLRQVFIELGGDKESLQDFLYRQVSESHEERKTFGEYARELFSTFAMPLPLFILSISFLLVLIFLLLWLLPFQNDFAKSIVIVIFTGAYSYILKQLKFPQITTHRPVTRTTPPSSSAEQYEDFFLSQINNFKTGNCKAKNGKKGRHCERLVIFVDDLDRLSAEEMVLGLDAVRTFMEISESRLPHGLGVVFVISCDETRVAHALSERHSQGDMPGTVFKESDARRYLDRIFQFRLEIPPFPREDMRQYAIKQLRELPGIAEDLNSHDTQLETLVNRMIHVEVNNPRNALQIINAFVQSFWLAKKRETEALGTEKPGGLHEGSVTKYLEALGALSAIKVDFPDFYQQLQKDPSLLHRMTDVLVRGKPLEEQPLQTQQLIREQYYIKKKGTQSQDNSIKLKPEYRPLRQFLSSLIGLRWPDSLQNLLLLSQDPVTRKFGPKAPHIYNQFVSGDSQGVLEGLGRHIDANPLRDDEARLLYQMMEELRSESEARRVAASRAVADLVDRLPQNMAYLLSGSLCRELGDSIDLRSQLGIQKIQKILTIAYADDQKSVASRLVEDVLTTDEPVKLRLETMEPPNLEEAIEFARATVNLSLPIRREYGLDPAADNQLITWLTDRTVRIENSTSQLPFKDLESWMAEHEDHILLDLTDSYTEMLAAEFEREVEPGFEVTPAINRASKIFDYLGKSGEESRPTLWQSLTRYVALNVPEASQVGWKKMVEYHTSTSLRTSDLVEFLNAFIDRLTNEAQNNDWPLDFVESAAEKLLVIVRERGDEIDNGVFKALANLAILWSQTDDKASLSCNAAEELQNTGSSESKNLFDNWAQRVIGDLPISCVEFMASRSLVLESPTQSSIASQFNHIISNEKIDDHVAERYGAFTKALPDSAWDTEGLKTHLDKLLPQIAARHANPNNYLRKVFPHIINALEHASPGVLGESLQTLFTQAKNHPKHYDWLHSMMVENWPEASEELKPYDPKQIFNDGTQFAQSQPKQSSKDLLQSLTNILEKDLVSVEQRAALIESACSIWTAKPGHAIKTFKDGYGDLSPEQTANLMDSIDLNNEKHRNLLFQAWSAIIQHYDREKMVQTINHILDKGIRGPEDEPDMDLRLWLDALGESRHEILLSTITQPELNDEYRRRLWWQVVRIGESLGPKFFIESIPQIVGFSKVEKTASDIFAEYELVWKALASADNRAELSQRLIERFPEGATNTIKSNIADWCKKLSGDTVLSKLSPDSLADEDMTILETNFGRTRELNKIKGRRKSE